MDMVHMCRLLQNAVNKYIVWLYPFSQ